MFISMFCFDAPFTLRAGVQLEANKPRLGLNTEITRLEKGG